MTNSQIESLRELADDCGVDFDSIDEIDTDGCGCSTCMDMARDAIQAAAYYA